MSSSEKQENPASTTTCCSKHNVPLILELLPMPLRGAPDGFYYCPVCEEQNQRAARAAAAQENYKALTRGIPLHYHSATLNQFEADLIAPVIDWAHKPCGPLFVSGGCGVGKTHLACAVQKHLNTAGGNSTLVFSAEMLLELRMSFNKNSGFGEDKVLEKYAPKERRHVVIFDDVCSQKSTEYAVGVWYEILNRLNMNNSPAMFTTNLTPKEIAVALGDRTASRMLHGYVVELNGPDRRMSKHWTDKDE